MNIDKLYDSTPKKAAIAAGTTAALFTGIGLAGGFSGDTDPTSDNIAASTSELDNTTTSEKNTTTTEAIATTVAETQQDIDELINNIYKNPENDFQCADEGVETGTLDVADNGEIIEVLYSEMNVDRTSTDTDTRRWSDALSSPVTADLADKKAVAREIYAAWCAQPDLLAAALVFEANLTIGDRTVGKEVEWLEEFFVSVDDINEVADKLRLPHQGNQLTADQLAENKAANDNRIELAEKLANAYYNKQNYGVQTDAAIESSIALDPLSATYESDNASEYVETTGYTGDAIAHGMTVKIGDCAILLTGFNIEDKRPVLIINSKESCDTPENPDTPGTTTSTTSGNTTSTVKKETTSTTGPEEETTTSTTGSTSTTGRKGSVPTTQAAPPTTIGGTTTETFRQPPATATPDTLPNGVTPTTIDFVPVPSTAQLPDAPPITATVPTTGVTAPPVTAPSDTVVQTTRVTSR